MSNTKPTLLFASPNGADAPKRSWKHSSRMILYHVSGELQFSILLNGDALADYKQLAKDDRGFFEIMNEMFGTDEPIRDILDPPYDEWLV